MILTIFNVNVNESRREVLIFVKQPEEIFPLKIWERGMCYYEFVNSLYKAKLVIQLQCAMPRHALVSEVRPA